MPVTSDEGYGRVCAPRKLYTCLMADGPRVMETAMPIDDKGQVLPPHLTFMYRDAREGDDVM